MRRLLVAALWTLGAGVAVAGQTPTTPGVQVPTDSPAMRANLLPRPRVRIGEWLTLEVIAKLQGDLARFDRVVDEDDEEFYWGRRRLGIRGELWGRVGFEVEREFGYEEEPWRDVYVNVRASDLFEVRGGKFKVPFGLDNLTSSTTTTSSSGRWPRAPSARAGPLAGWPTAKPTGGGSPTPSASSMVATSRPPMCCSMTMTRGATFRHHRRWTRHGTTVRRRRSLPRGLRNMEFGANVVWSRSPIGLYGFRGRSVFGYEFFERVYVNGDRLRVGADVAVRAGPTSLKAGGWRTANRQGQGLGNIDLPELFGRGW